MSSAADLFASQATSGVNTSQLNPVFAQRMQELMSAAEAATGSKVEITSGYRSPEHQAQIYANYTQKPVTYNGTVYKPNGTSGIAAGPGKSEHQTGTAMDINPSGAAYKWMVQHAPAYGIESGTTWSGSQYDAPHFQLPRSDVAAALRAVPPADIPTAGETGIGQTTAVIPRDLPSSIADLYAAQAQAPAPQQQTVNINGHPYVVGQSYQLGNGASFTAGADGKFTKTANPLGNPTPLQLAVQSQQPGAMANLNNTVDTAKGLAGAAGGAVAKLGGLFGGLFSGGAAPAPAAPANPNGPSEWASQLAQLYSPAAITDQASASNFYKGFGLAPAQSSDPLTGFSSIFSNPGAIRAQMNGQSAVAQPTASTNSSGSPDDRNAALMATVASGTPTGYAAGRPSSLANVSGSPDERGSQSTGSAPSISSLYGGANSSGSPDERQAANDARNSSISYTGQGIAGTVQMPPGARPSSVPDMSGQSSSGQTARDVGQNNGGWGAYTSPSSVASLYDTPPPAAPAAAPAQTHQMTTAPSFAEHQVTEHVQQLNPAYQAWEADQSKAAMYGVEGVASPTLDANGNVKLPSSYVGSSTPAPPKYITVPKITTIRVPVAAPKAATVSAPTPAPIAAPAPAPQTLVQLYQSQGLSPSAAYAKAAAPALASQPYGGYQAAGGPFTGNSGGQDRSGGSIAGGDGT